MQRYNRNIRIYLRKDKDFYQFFFEFYADESGDNYQSGNNYILYKSRKKTDQFFMDLKKYFSSILKKIFDTLKENGTQFINNDEFYNHLIDIIEIIKEFSSNFLYDMFEDDIREKFIRQFKKLFWKKMNSLIYNEFPLGIIEYDVSLKHFIPLDYLLIPFLEKPDMLSRPQNLNQIILCFSQVLGFSFLIQRNILRDKVAPLVPLDSKNKMNMALYINPELKYANDESFFFKVQNKKIFSSLIYEPHTWDKPAEKLYQRLSEEAASFKHLCCHCSTSPSNPNSDPMSHYLQFKTKKIELGKIRSCFIDDRTANKKKNNKKSLLFLNTCESSNIDPFSVHSFPHFFLNDLEYPALIGTEYKIPDKFAADFSKIFYAFFAKSGILGTALFYSRLFCLKKQRNPLGLFYTLYGNPEIKITHRKKSVNY